MQTRVYEKLRFSRVRQSQLNGEDLRDRWHNALKDLDEDGEIDPESVKMRVRCSKPITECCELTVLPRIVGCTLLMPKLIR